MLAEITTKLPDPNSAAAVGWVALTIFAILGGIYVALCVWEKVMPKPSGSEAFAKAAASFAAKADLERVERELTELRKERKQDVGNLHDRIDILQKEMGAVQATTEMVGKQVENLDTKLDGIEGRIITTLKNTGAI